MTTPSLAPWPPPADYVPVESKLEGVTVFAPRPTAEMQDVPRTFQCPQCGATTKYDVAAGGVACEYCGYTTPVAVQPVGERAEQFEFTLEALSQGSRGWGVARKELHCDTCGADIALAEGALTATCPFCASNKVNMREAAVDQLRPRALIPFKIQPADTKARAREWLGKGWFHPPELANSALIDHFTGVYLPFWLFNARLGSRWRAEVGYERTESYYDSDDKTWKTRTVIDWRWEDGANSIDVSNLAIPGTARLSRLILDRLQPFDVNALTPYTPDFLAGWQAQSYDVNLPTAWEQGKDAMRGRAKEACHAQINSSHVRNFSLTADFADETWRYVLWPVYVTAYRFEDKVFQVMVNGQTGAVAGQKPVAWWKIWLAIAALLSPGLCLGLISLPLLLAGGVGLIPLIFGGVLFALGAGAAFYLYRQAVNSEAA